MFDSVAYQNTMRKFTHPTEQNIRLAVEESGGLCGRVSTRGDRRWLDVHDRESPAPLLPVEVIILPKE